MLFITIYATLCKSSPLNLTQIAEKETNEQNVKHDVWTAHTGQTNSV